MKRVTFDDDNLFNAGEQQIGNQPRVNSDRPWRDGRQRRGEKAFLILASAEGEGSQSYCCYQKIISSDGVEQGKPLTHCSPLFVLQRFILKYGLRA